MALTLLALLVLAVLALLPLLFVLARPTIGRERDTAAIDLHRAQLAELARERAVGRIDGPDYDAAVLEVQRRLLAADRLGEPAARAGNRWPIVAACVVLPIAAAGLYSLSGHPELPAEPMSARLAESSAAADPVPDPPTTDATIAQLRAKLATAPDDETTREGYILLGRADNGRGNLANASKAWHRAVAIRFDPDLAALAAEAGTRASGVTDAVDRGLFARALAEGAPDAPWRATAERRLATSRAASPRSP